MNHDAAPSPVRTTAELTSSVVPFADLPGQSRLFLDYLKDPRSLRSFYPNAPASLGDLSAFAPQVLAEYTTDREWLCDALAETNRRAGSSERTFENIERLRQTGTVAVVTGQQAGLFTGPLYTIYKALTAVKLAGELSSAGTPAVPVFWVATEDHDFAEVSWASVLGRDAALTKVVYPADPAAAERPVGSIEIKGQIGSAIDELFAALPGTEFTGGLRDSIELAWQPGEGFGAGFERQVATLLAEFGIVIIDPLHPALKELSSPLYANAVENADTIVEAIRRRGAELTQAGYHEQVLVEEEYFPLFWHNDAGQRLALRRTGDGLYKVKGDGREFTRSEVEKIARMEPARFSPGVMLRPVVQDHLMPTVCYIGGGAEVAYFAQNSEAYRVLGRPVTPIMHRQSFTIVEARQRRTLERSGLSLPQLFDGMDANLLRIGGSEISARVRDDFDSALATIDQQLQVLRSDIEGIDMTLLPALDKRGKKIRYHIESLRKKTYLARARNDETAERQLRDTMTALLPDGHLQERVLNVSTFLNKYGPYFVDWLYEATDVNERGHKLLYI